MVMDTIMQAEEPLPSRAFRILSFDGGPSGLRFLKNLEHIVQQVPTFLSKVDLFAGNSNGALFALYLATKTREELSDGLTIVAELQHLQRKFLEFFRIRLSCKQLCRMTGFMAGLRPLLDTDELESFLRQEEILGSRTMDDLLHKVVIVSFRLFGFPRNKENPIRRPWGPHIYTNLLPDSSHPHYDERFDKLYFGSTDPEFRHKTLVEFVLRSGSLPIFTPIYSGFIDGAVFANNPQVVAIAQTLSARNWINEMYNKDEEGNFLAKGWIRGPENILVFSLGGDDSRFSTASVEKDLRKAHKASTRNNKNKLEWGWFSWIFRPTSPLLLLKLLLTADGRGTDIQSKNLLQAVSSFRLATQSQQGALGDFYRLFLFDSSDLEKDAKKRLARWTKATPDVVSFFAEVLRVSGLVNLPETKQPALKLANEDETHVLGPLHRLLMQALEQLGVPSEEAHKTSEQYIRAQNKLSALAAWIVDEAQAPELPVVDKVRLAIKNAGPSAEGLARFIASFANVLLKNNVSPKYFNHSYLVTMLWIELVWSTPDERLEVMQPLLHLLADPYYFLPLVDVLREYEDFNSEI